MAVAVHPESDVVAGMVDCTSRAEVVLTEELAPIILGYLDRQEGLVIREWGAKPGTKIANGNRANAGFESVVPPVREFYCQRAGVSVRALYRMLSGESLYIDWGVADRMLFEAQAHISDVELYDRKEVLQAALYQTSELIDLVYRCRGGCISPNDRRLGIPRVRREIGRQDSGR